MQPKQVKWSTQESPSQTEHLIPQPRKIQEFPLSHYWKGGGAALFVFCWGGNGQEQNGSVVAWQRYLPVTITVSNTYCNIVVPYLAMRSSYESGRPRPDNTHSPHFLSLCKAAGPDPPMQQASYEMGIMRRG